MKYIHSLSIFVLALACGASDDLSEHQSAIIVTNHMPTELVTHVILTNKREDEDGGTAPPKHNGRKHEPM